MVALTNHQARDHRQLTPFAMISKLDDDDSDPLGCAART